MAEIFWFPARLQIGYTPLLPMNAAPLSLILSLLFSLSCGTLARGGDEPIWRVQKAGASLEIRDDKFANGWGKIQGKALYLKYRNGEIISSIYPQYMGAIAGVIQEGLALQTVWTVPHREVGQPRILFLASGDVELGFDRRDPKKVIVLSRKEAREFVAAVQGYFQKALDRQKPPLDTKKAEQQASAPNDKDSLD